MPTLSPAARWTARHEEDQMKYNQPYGVSDPNAAYINGDPSVGRAGSIPPAESIEYPQREIVNFLVDTGLTPVNTDLHQLAKSVQWGKVMYAVDSGPVNAVAVTLTPPLTAYQDGQIFRVRINLSNTGPATFNAGPGPVNIVRRGGAVLQAGDLPAGYMTMLTYSALHNNVELYGASFAPASFVPILAANSNLYVNGTTGDDTIYDGTSATISGAHGPFKTITRAVTETFKYGPSVYTMTINVAAGTYPERVVFPQVIGPTVILNGAGTANTFITGVAGTSMHTVLVTGPNQLTVQNCTVSQPGGAGGASCFSAANGATIIIQNCATGSAGGYIFNSYGGYMFVGTHTFNAGTSCLSVITSFWGGFFNIGVGAVAAVWTFAGACTCSGPFAAASSAGQISVPNPPYVPTFPGAGSVTGSKYNAALNGVINTQGQSVSFLPGNSAGTTGSGGQYG